MAKAIWQKHVVFKVQTKTFSVSIPVQTTVPREL